MKFETVKELDDEKFRRLAGVKRTTNVEYDVVLIDATETPIERPKKAKALLFREEENTHTEEPNCGRQEESTNHLYSIYKWEAARLPVIQRVKNTTTSQGFTT